jgi:hypothetical protein
MYPQWQEARQLWGIAFTGHEPADGEMCCPSQLRRPVETINRWPGNRPVT